MPALYRISFFIFILIYPTFQNTLFAQFGKNGVQTILVPSVVLNQYTTLQANAAAGESVITLSNIIDLNNPNPLEAGDLLFIIQMQGASINNTNGVNYGEVIAYNGAGNYEFAYVQSIAGNTITLSCPLQQSYTTAGRTQIVRVPQYQELIVPMGSTISAPAWNGSKGGIVAIYTDTLQLDGQINASNLGFRGGALDNSATNNQANYLSTAANAGAEKGESIAGFQSEYTILGGRFGRGAPANGGGGGNGNNGGGGGGANGGLPSAWFRGAGVMCSTCSGATAWSLDPDYIANGNALTNSAGGGRGGYTTSTSNRDALTVAPGNALWGSDRRRPHGGLGGRPLDGNPENRIFFGGGGGAGDQNNNSGGRGGNGGGIVLIVANHITGNGIIQANGENGENTRNTHNDGAGGGGGGGTIIIKSENQVSNISLNAFGGNGGNQFITSNQAQGTGGGGGGGVITVFSANDNSIKNVSGGENGTTTSNALTEFPANGATSGNSGSIATGSTSNFILACNLPPTPQNDFVTTNEDAPVSGNLASNDSDLESLTLAYQAGTFTTTQGGSITIATNGTFNYTPLPNFNGTDTYTYTICDNGRPSNQCATATLTIQVLPINDSPQAQNDNFTMNEDETLTGDVSLNDNDGDPEITQALTYTLINGGTATANGTLMLNANGTFTYTPNPNFNGLVSFTYQVCDNGTPVLCASANVSITINPINDPPQAQNDNFTMNEDEALTGDVSLNDNDGDPEITQNLTYTLINGGTATANGTLVLNADGTFTYTPNPNFNGLVSFTYQVCDDGTPVLCTSASVSITINPINDLPQAQDDTFSMNTGTTLNESVATNDADVDNLPTELTFSLTNGSSAVANGNLLFNPDGTFSYTPNPLFVGVVNFTYQVCDPAGACSQALVTISVIGQIPTAQNADFIIDEDAQIEANLLDKVSPNTQISFSLASIGNANENGLLSLLPNGNFTFVPKENFNGLITFEYKVCNFQNQCSQVALVQIAVSPVNDAPIAQDNNFSTLQSQAVSGNLAENDFDIDGDPLLYGSGVFSTKNGGSLDIKSDGSFTYTPAYGFVGKDCFEYEVCDPQGACSKANLCIVVENAENIFIPEAFSPNGDGLYDYFVIEGVAGKKVSLKIFNRWGNLVYQNADYQNNWNGIGNEGLHKGENLPDGTYYYVIDFGEGAKPKSNYVIIKR